MTKITKQNEEAFEEFLVELPLLLEDLQTLLGESRGYGGVRVGFDDEALGKIESFYLDCLAGKEKPSVSPARLDRIIIAYYGEALIERKGGKWLLNDAVGDASFATPVVGHWSEEEVPRFSPVERRELQKENREPFLVKFIHFAERVENLEEDLFKDL